MRIVDESLVTGEASNSGKGRRGFSISHKTTAVTLVGGLKERRCGVQTPNDSGPIRKLSKDDGTI